MAIAAGLLATGLSLLLAYGQSVWFDENYSILLAKSSLPELLALTGVDAHPPLYYITLHIWGNIWGWDAGALRSLSAILAGGAVAMMIVLLRKLFTARVAVTTAPFLVLAPFALRYGYEIRMYALVVLIGVLATWVLVRAREGNKRSWWIAYAVLVAAGMYTLYMSMVIWLAHLVWLVATTKDKKKLLKQPFVLAYAGAVALFVPYLPTFIHQMLNSALPGIGSEITLTKLASVLGMITVYTPEWLLGGWLSLILVAVMVLFGIVYATVWKEKKYRTQLLLLSLLVIVPLGFYALTSLPPRQPIFIERYMAHIAIYMYALTAVVAVLGWLHGDRRRLAGILGAVVLVLSTWGVVRLDMVGNLNLERMQHPQTANFAKNALCNQDTTVVADDPYTYIDSEYYFNKCTLRFFSKDNVNFQGGYAPLHDSDKRVADAAAVTTPRIVHLRWDGNEPTFLPSSEYRLVESKTYDKQVVDIYQR